MGKRNSIYMRKNKLLYGYESHCAYRCYNHFRLLPNFHVFMRFIHGIFSLANNLNRRKKLLI